MCEEFQKSWSARERYSRRNWVLVKPVRKDKATHADDSRPLDVVLAVPNELDLRDRYGVVRYA